MGEIQAYGWLPTKQMIADVLTKEKSMPEIVSDLVSENKCPCTKSDVNSVQFINREIKMLNIRNRPHKNQDYVSTPYYIFFLLGPV